MIEAMTEFKILKKLVNLTKATLKNVRCRIKIQKYLSEPFTTERGLRQGDSLACLLFNLVLGKCIRDSGLDRSGTLWNRSLQLLAYADDIDIIGRSEKAVKEAFQALEISATNMGLTINEYKTKFMETLPSSVNNTSFCVNGHSFERVSEFKYHGTIINDQNKLKAEINNRIKSANKCFFFGLKKQLRLKFISGKTKLRLYKTLILPVLLYASETWTLNLETIRVLETFERKALRTIFGPVKDQGCWRTRYNFELYRLYKEPKVTQVIRSNRLRWLGHIWRSPENNQTRAYAFKNPMGSRPRGRPPTRWIDDVENDFKTLNIKNWQRVAAYRWNWKKRAVEVAKTCNRLLRL
ncbi:reverse transcriptase domain-containing protein [Trichonephila clavipes]|nr:reverse transcriptase domain-containing protein [Trichonephila clavipes]